MVRHPLCCAAPAAVVAILRPALRCPRHGRWLTEPVTDGTAAGARRAVPVVIAAVVVLEGVGLLSLGWGLDRLAWGDYPMTLLGISSAIAALAAAGLGAWSVAALSQNRWTWVSVDAEGTTIRRRRPWVWLARGAAAATAICGLCGTVFCLQGRENLPLGWGFSADDWVVPGIVAVCGLLLVYRTFGPVAAGYLRLTPTGVVFRGVVNGSARVRWSDIADIAERPSWPLTCTLVDEKGGGPVLIGAQPPQSTNFALYRLIRHYWANPADRDELTDGRVAERVAEPGR